MNHVKANLSQVVDLETKETLSKVKLTRRN